MPISLHKDDILTHVSTDKSLSSQVASIQGCITVIAFAGCKIDVCYTFSSNEIKVSAILKTPIGDLDLGHATLDPNDPRITLSGSLDGFKAEVSIEFDFATLEMELCGKACAPFVGCASGCTSIKF